MSTSTSTSTSTATKEKVAQSSRTQLDIPQVEVLSHQKLDLLERIVWMLSKMMRS